MQSSWKAGYLLQGGESMASPAFAPPTTICISADGMNTVPAAPAEMATNVSIIRHVPGPGCRKVVRRGQVGLLPSWGSILQFSKHRRLFQLRLSFAWKTTTGDWKNQKFAAMISALRSSRLPEPWKERSLEDIFSHRCLCFLRPSCIQSQSLPVLGTQAFWWRRAGSCRKCAAVGKGYETLRKVCNIFVESIMILQGEKRTHIKVRLMLGKKGRKKKKQKTKKELSVFNANSLQGSCRSNYQPVTCGDGLGRLTVTQIPTLLDRFWAHKLHRKWC